MYRNNCEETQKYYKDYQRNCPECDSPHMRVNLSGTDLNTIFGCKTCGFVWIVENQNKINCKYKITGEVK